MLLIYLRVEAFDHVEACPGKFLGDASSETGFPNTRIFLDIMTYYPLYVAMNVRMSSYLSSYLHFFSFLRFQVEL